MKSITKNETKIINAFTETLKVLQNFIVKEFVSFEEKFAHYTALTESHSGEFTIIDLSSLKKNFINEVSYFYMLCFLYKNFLLNRYGIEIDKKEIYAALDQESIYSFDFPDEINNFAIDKFLKIDLGKFTTKVISDFYEVALETQEKKRLGQFYTPNKIVRTMISELKISNFLKSKEEKLIDPACGAGIFLIEIIKKIKTKVKGLELAKLVYNKIFGNDINFFAVILTKLNITFEIIKTINSNDEIREFIALYSNFQNIRIKNTVMNIEENTFDYIIGNPPYFKIKNKNINYHEGYVDIIFGQQNIYTLFIYWAIKSGKPSGKISFIVPQSFRTGLYFIRLRRELSYLHLMSIINFKSRTHLFPNVEQAVLIITFQKKNRKKNYQVKIGNVEELNIETADFFKVDSSKVIWGEKFDFYLFIPTNRPIFNIIEKIYGQATNLKTMGSLSFGTGGYVWNQHKGLLTDDFTENSAPIIYNAFIDKHDFLSKEVNNSKKSTEKKLYSFKDPKVAFALMEGKKLLIQRTSTFENLQRIKASVISEEFLNKYPVYFLENHVNYLYCIDDKNKPIENSMLFFYQALFNSKLLNFIFKSKNGNTQVAATELNLLPISFRKKDEIIAVMENYYITRNKLLLEEVENLVFENYLLNNDEIRLILTCNN